MAEAITNPAAAAAPARSWQDRLAAFKRPGPAQFGLMAAAAAVVALGVALWLWAGATSYSVLYRGLPEAEAGQVMEALTQNNIPFRVDTTTGALMVPDDQVHAARLKLAAQGLPKGVAGEGFELLDGQNGFGVSQFMENARYQRALEGELARSVMSIASVANARVHLAIPKETVFVRDRQPPTASVLVELHPGRVLDDGQVAAIVHLVSSSVPKLARDQVSVVDQAGNLLTRPGRDASLALSLDQMDYQRRLEEDYIRKIENLLVPVMGQGRVRAQVALDLDFTVTEQTAERYETPNGPQVRSERSLTETNNRPRAGGIPGALSNQPPGATEVPEELPEDGAQPTQAQLAAEGNGPQRSREESTRNLELDKIISHTRNQPGRVVRLSAAVVLDHKLVANEEGVLTPTPLTEEELAKAEALVRQAVGFTDDRGDTVDVINVAFAASPFAAGEALPLWQEKWFIDLVKWGVTALIILLAIILVVRPLVNRLLPERTPAQESDSKALALAGEQGEVLEDDTLEGMLDDQVFLGSNNKAQGRHLEHLDKRLRTAKALVAEDPKRAVQVIRNWIATELEEA